jgi:hypothetical protein
MLSNWYQSGTLAAEHRASMEKAASRRQVRRSIKRWRRKDRAA